MSVGPRDLVGQTRARFDVWRSLGLSESAAMEQVRRDGLVAGGDGFDRLVEVFEALGLSASAARTAAIGRDGGGESAARRAWRAAANAPSNWQVTANEALDRQFREELDRAQEQLEAIRWDLEQMTDADWADGP